MIKGFKELFGFDVDTTGMNAGSIEFLSRMRKSRICGKEATLMDFSNGVDISDKQLSEWIEGRVMYLIDKKLEGNQYDSTAIGSGNTMVIALGNAKKISVYICKGYSKYEINL